MVRAAHGTGVNTIKEVTVHSPLRRTNPLIWNQSQSQVEPCKRNN